MSDEPRKPTGSVVPMRLSGRGAMLLPVRFPKTKGEMERYIVQQFLKEAEADKSLPFSVSGVTVNDLDDFDCTLETSIGTKYLELMEVAPLEHLKGSHASAPSSYKPYDFAEYIVRKLLKKSLKYRGATNVGLIFLMYMTHWAFVPSNTVVELLQYWVAHRVHSFERIYFYVPLAQDEGYVYVIHPAPPSVPTWVRQGDPLSLM